MKIQLIDKNETLVKSWEYYFDGMKDVELYHDSIFDIKTDCIVSPANSFGFMDGGLDLLITRKLGVETQYKIQKLIKDNYNGELLVGQALIVETNNNDIPYCISAPTMRVPMFLKDSINVYLASKAIFTLIKDITYIDTVSISGLGTGVGQLPEGLCAKQMFQAYIEVMLNKYKYPTSWYDAQQKHVWLTSNDINFKPKDIQYENKN